MPHSMRDKTNTMDRAYREEAEMDGLPSEKPCPKCGSPMHYIGTDCNAATYWYAHYACTGKQCFHAEGIGWRRRRRA